MVSVIRRLTVAVRVVETVDVIVGHSGCGGTGGVGGGV